MRIVVGWRRDHAGSQPLNMNIGPSVAREERITPSVELDPGPEAFMIRLFSTSAGEQIVVATVPAAKLAVK